MTIQYIWSFSNIKVKQLGEQSNVVHSYTATITGSADEFSESKDFEITTSSEKEIEGFVAFDQLTKEQFILWTEQALGLLIDGAKSNIKRSIANQLESLKYQSVDAPWST
jgi:hypothetical protein